MKKQSLWKSLAIIVAGFAALSASGCATTKTADNGPVFFPPPPNPPRIQYLTSISSSGDIEGRKSGFSVLLFGESGADREKPIVKPYEIVSRGTTMFVSDTGQGRVIRIDLAQKKFEFLKGDQGVGKLKKPVAISLDSTGQLYVADTARKDVAVYDLDGTYLRSYGKGTVNNPVGVAADTENVYILDNRTNSIKVIDRKTDEMIREIGKGNAKEESIALPNSLTIDDKGLLHVTNLLSGRLLTFDRDGHVVRGFGKVGDTFGAFARPRGLHVDADGITYVVDAGHQNVQMFNETGRLLMFFGDPGLPKGSLNLPAGVTVSKESAEYFKQFVDPSFELEKIIFVTNQYGTEKIAVYGFGHTKTPEKYVTSKPKPPAAAAGAAPAAGGAAQPASSAPQAPAPAVPATQTTTPAPGI